ncbi:MAG: diaminopimelate decarboxylase [Gammaproteobacteria bacterium]|nr:diaminopimelate decarboxylase [Pseudomonadales bacterium]MCP5347520.1 diaminopimelate decarboxylase [Pseudomonadales bacterium]
MEAFSYHNGELYAEQVPLTELAERYGTPCYVYSRAAIEENFRAYEEALGDRPHLTCYAVKANSNLAVLQVLARLGAGFDIVSGGELERVLRAGGDPAKIIFSGVGKTGAEIEAALKAGIHCFNVESEAELLRISGIAAQLGCVAPVSLRVNPDVDAGTHPYISTGLKENKFGIDSQTAPAIYRQAATLPAIEVVGIDCHIGSQLTDLAPYLDALDRVLAIVDQLAASGIAIRHLDLGGGLGVTYKAEQPPTPGNLISAIQERLANRDLTLLLEPGRSITANAGLFLVEVEYVKHTAHKNFIIVDGAMNDLLRPALYGAYQAIVAVRPREDLMPTRCDVVGPVCESADFLGKDRELAVEAGDLLAVRSAGAYGFVMSSNYNSRNRAAEIMVDGAQSMIVRRRETLDDQLGLEQLLRDNEVTMK